jgi:Helix-turn-helix domain
MKRDQPSETLLTLQQARQRLGLSENAMAKLVRTGAIRAIDVSAPGARRRTWRIDPEALDAFLAERTTPRPAPRRRRRRKQQNVTQYF